MRARVRAAHGVGARRPRSATDTIRTTGSIEAAAQLLGEGAPVSSAAAAAGLSERQLERSFRRYLGMSPKTYARVLRFRRAVRLAKSDETLAAAAALAGFADQAHFTREARALCGTSPQKLIRHVGNVQDVVAGHNKL